MGDQGLPLYIGNLPEHYKENDLTAFFKQKSFDLNKVVFGKPRNNGRQFAFIYTSSENASKILEQLNYATIDGHEIIIMKYMNDAQKIRPELNVFLKNLPARMNSRDLHDEILGHFPKATIESAKVGKDKDGRSLDYGYVYFSKQSEDVVKDLIQRKTIKIKENEVRVSAYKKQTSETSNIYFKEFPKEWKSDDEVKKFLRQSTVPFTSTYIPVNNDNHGQQSLRGFAFADFGTYQNAVKFIATVCALSEEEVRAKYSTDDSVFRSHETDIYISRALSRRERNSQLMRKQKQYKKELRERTKNKNIYVNNFPEDYNDEKLAELFRPYGTITSAKVMLEDSHKSKCFGFVCFETIDEAKSAIANLKDRIIGSKKLTVCIAESKAARKKKIQQHFINNSLPPYSFVPQIPASGYAPFQRPPRMMATMPYPQIIPTQPIRQNVPPYSHPYVTQQYMPPPPPPEPQQQRQDYNILVQGKSPEEQKELLGEIIYNIAAKEDKETAPKITGMLLELEVGELIYQLNSDHMRSKIQEAREVLRDSNSNT